MATFVPSADPVTLFMHSKGSTWTVYQAIQNEKAVGAYRFDWNRSGSGIHTVVGYGHAIFVVPFARIMSTVAGYTGRFTIFSDFWDMTAYDPGFRTGMTEYLIKHHDKHEASHRLVQPKSIVAMGVRVAAAVQAASVEGHSIPRTDHTNRADFETLVTQHGLPTKRPVPQ